MRGRSRRAGHAVALTLAGAECEPVGSDTLPHCGPVAPTVCIALTLGLTDAEPAGL